MLYQFGHFEFDSAHYELRSGDERTPLPGSLNRLLLLFVSHPGELVTREQIAAALWRKEEQATVDIPSGINTAIRRLRAAIGDNNGHGVFIETVVGVGYRFAARVSLVSPKREETTVEPAQTSLEPAQTSRARPKLWLGSVVCGVFLLLAAKESWRVYASRQAAHHATERLAQLGTEPLLLHSHPVTFDEPEDNLTAQAISPSGTYMATSDSSGLTLYTIANGEKRLLDAPKVLCIRQIAWLPDESALLVTGSASQPALEPKRTSRNEVEPESQTWRVSLSGELPRLLLKGAALVSASPDGRYIAYATDGRSEIWIAGPTGDSQRLLLHAPGGDSFNCLLWSPRSDRIVVNRLHKGLPSIMAGVDPASLGTREDASYESYDAVSGTLLAQQKNVRFDSAILLKDGTLIYPVNAPPDTAKLVAVRTDPSTGALLATPPEMAGQRPLDFIASAITQLTMTADGTTLSLMVDRAAYEVYIADLAEASNDEGQALEHIMRLTRHTDTDFPTAWSPDSSEVVFDAGVGGPISVVGQPVNGSAMHIFGSTVSKRTKFAQGDFSADGRWLLFMNLSFNNSQVKDIERVPAHGGTPEIVPTTGQVEEFHCSISPKGRCVLREIDGKNYLIFYALDPVLGMGTELARVPWQPTILGDWSISPDGATIAMANHDPAHPGIQLVPLARGSSKDEQGTVSQIPVAGFGTVLDANWSTDGQHFFVETYAAPGYDLLSSDLEGQLSLLRTSHDLIWAVPSPDGKRIAFPALGPAKRNVWIGSTDLAALR